MPLKSMADAGLGGSPYPWVDKNDIIGVPVAILQAFGMLNQQNQFQVAHLCQLLEDRFLENGDSVPAQFLVSIDAKGRENPRRRILDYFADAGADPIGPMMLQKVDANNQAGWAWSWRECPLPADMVPVVDQIERSQFRQDWKRMMESQVAQQRADTAAANGHQRAPVPARQADELEDLPF